MKMIIEPKRSIKVILSVTFLTIFVCCIWLAQLGCVDPLHYTGIIGAVSGVATLAIAVVAFNAFEWQSEHTRRLDALDSLEKYIRTHSIGVMFQIDKKTFAGYRWNPIASGKSGKRGGKENLFDIPLYFTEAWFEFFEPLSEFQWIRYVPEDIKKHIKSMPQGNFDITYSGEIQPPFAVLSRANDPNQFLLKHSSLNMPAWNELEAYFRKLLELCEAS